jgi:hypothetical protein
MCDRTFKIKKGSILDTNTNTITTVLEVNGLNPNRMRKVSVADNKSFGRHANNKNVNK